MEETGKPIIPVPASPLYNPGLEFGGRYGPVLLGSAGAAMRALDRMAWYQSYMSLGEAEDR